MDIRELLTHIRAGSSNRQFAQDMRIDRRTVSRYRKWAHEQNLLERDDSQRWEMQEALLILAHDGSAEAVAVLEAYRPRAHTRLEGFAECALDEGRYFATIPRNAEEARMMMKREVLSAWENRAIDAQTKIDEEIEVELERRRYELEIAQRLLARAQDDAARETWRIQVDVLDMLIGMAEGDLEKQREELALCDAMIAEIEADLGAGEMEDG